MSVEIPKRYIEDAIAKYKSDLKKRIKKKKPVHHKHLITISRQEGSGGRIIAEKLAQKLNISLWNKEILEVIADQSGWGYQAQMFEALDESAQNIIDTFVSDFLGKAAKDSYFHLLPKAIYVIAQNSAVILGRGAHLILPEAFSVHIKASFNNRLQNMIKYENMDTEAARTKLLKKDRERENFAREFGRKLCIQDRPYNFDLVISTNRYSIDDAVSIILHAYELYRNKALN